MHCECQLRARIREQLPIKIILTTWLAMWAMGEVISLLSLAPHAGWVLAHWTEVFPALVRGGRASFPISTDDRAGQLFVAGWLIPWTGAGLVVGGLLLRLLFGADSVALDRTELVVRRRLGPLSWSSRVPCESIRLLAVSPKTHALVAETEARRWTLSTFGTRAEREQALAELQSALGTQASQLPARSLVPAGWTTSVAAGGWTELVRSRDVFRPAVMQGTWALALLIAAAAPEAISPLSYLHGLPQMFALFAAATAAFSVYQTLAYTSRIRLHAHELVVTTGYPVTFAQQHFSHPILSVTCETVKDTEVYTLWAERGGQRAKLLTSRAYALPVVELGEWLAARLDMKLLLPEGLVPH